MGDFFRDTWWAWLIGGVLMIMGLQLGVMTWLMFTGIVGGGIVLFAFGEYREMFFEWVGRNWMLAVVAFFAVPIVLYLDAHLSSSGLGGISNFLIFAASFIGPLFATYYVYQKFTFPAKVKGLVVFLFFWVWIITVGVLWYAGIGRTYDAIDLAFYALPAVIGLLIVYYLSPQDRKEAEPPEQGTLYLGELEEYVDEDEE